MNIEAAKRFQWHDFASTIRFFRPYSSKKERKVVQKSSELPILSPMTYNPH